MLRRADLRGAVARFGRFSILCRPAQPAALCGLASTGRAPERGSNLQPSDDRDTTFCATSGLLAAWVCMDRGATINLVRSATPSPLDEAHDLLRIMGPAYPMRVLIPSLVLGAAPYQGYN